MADKDDDIGSAKADAMEKSIAEGERRFGPLAHKPYGPKSGGSNITRPSQIGTGEPTVSPLIQIYPKPSVDRYCKGGKVIKSERY